MKRLVPRVPARSEAAGLLLGSPCAVLARILAEDPLGLRARLAARLEGHALLFDLERAVLRAQATVALRAASWRGEGELAPWLEERLDEALAPFLGADRAGVPPASPALARLCEPLGLDAARLGAACLRFNRSPPDVRRAFFALLLEGIDAGSYSRANALPLGELARRARAALAPFRALPRPAGERT